MRDMGTVDLGGNDMQTDRDARVQAVYDDLKLRDRLTPGRTPWHTLRKRAEQIVERELVIENLPDAETSVLVDIVEGRHPGIETPRLVAAAREELERRAGAAYVENAGYQSASALAGMLVELERAGNPNPARIAILRLELEQRRVEIRIQSVVDECRTLIVGKLEGEHRRQAVTILAHAFGFDVSDPTRDALTKVAAELGIDLPS